MGTHRACRPNYASAPPDAGLGLAETLITIIILAIGVLALAGASARVGASVNSAHLRGRAIATAERQVETLLSKPYDQVLDGSATAAGVSMQWTCTDLVDAKEIMLVYEYTLPDGVRHDTITAAYRQP
jgi:Tfp pilus assembly protein PilV